MWAAEKIEAREKTPCRGEQTRCIWPTKVTIRHGTPLLVISLANGLV